MIDPGDTELNARIKADEGVRPKPYIDTEGILTIGVGRNLDDVGLSAGEIDMLLANDLRRSIRDCVSLFPHFGGFTPNRQRALVNMAFNLGLPRLTRFRKMRSAIDAGEWAEAAREALDSRWAKQVGSRAKRVATQLENG